jgi:hypothetical protein
VEAAGRTNHIENSSDASQWFPSDATIGSPLDSIINDEDAYPVTGDGKDPLDQIVSDAGNFSSNDNEVASAIIEKDTAPKSGLAVEDKTEIGSEIFAFYDWSTDTVSNGVSGGGFGTIESVNSRRITENGPNGNPVVELTLRYSGHTEGNQRRILFLCDFSAGGNTSIFHHAQLEEAPNASSPIVTQGSPVTRAGDDYSIPVGDWHNSFEGTWVLHVKPFQYHLGSNNNLFNLGNGSNIVALTGPEPFGLSTFNGNDTLTISSSINAFSTNRIGLAHDPSGRVLSINGTSDSDGDQGALGNLGPSIDLGGDSVGFAKVLYVPRALPESTLNALTTPDAPEITLTDANGLDLSAYVRG